MPDASPAPPAHLPLLRNPRALAALVAMPLFFATNLIVGRAAVATVSPWSLVFWRWVIALALLLPFAYAGLIRHRTVLMAHWRQLIVLAVLAVVICGGGVYVALQHTTATNANLIYATSTIMVVVFDALLARRRLPFAHVAGALIGLCGIVVIVLQGDLGRLASFRFNVGDLGILAAAISWAAYSLILRKGPLVEIGTVTTFTAIVIAGIVVLAPLMLFEMAHEGHAPHGLQGWGAIVFLAIFPSVLAFTLYQYAVVQAGASVTALFFYLLPVYGVALAVIVLGEELHGYHAIGLVLVLGGVMLATRPVKRANR
ncbi:DMT family transporter [Ancylobacter terrae]|uniref:DMT family transporter n=1 Tax=Ancylobacter sp. sgz301288 TaxID=3342077 RepID=UPI00385C81D8